MKSKCKLKDLIKDMIKDGGKTQGFALLTEELRTTMLSWKAERASL